MLAMQGLNQEESTETAHWRFFRDIVEAIVDLANKTTAGKFRGYRDLTHTGWWFGCHFLFSQKYWVSNHPLIDELIFFRGVAQPPTSLDISFPATPLTEAFPACHVFRATEADLHDL